MADGCERVNEIPHSPITAQLLAPAMAKISGSLFSSAFDGSSVVLVVYTSSSELCISEESTSTHPRAICCGVTSKGTLNLEPSSVVFTVP